MEFSMVSKALVVNLYCNWAEFMLENMGWNSCPIAIVDW